MRETVRCEIENQNPKLAILHLFVWPKTNDFIETVFYQ